MKLLGFRRGDLRAGQLRVNVVRDGLNGRPQTRATVSAQMAGSELARTKETEEGYGIKLEYNGGRSKLGIITRLQKSQFYHVSHGFNTGQSPGVTEPFPHLPLWFL